MYEVAVAKLTERSIFRGSPIWIVMEGSRSVTRTYFVCANHNYALWRGLLFSNRIPRLWPSLYEVLKLCTFKRATVFLSVLLFFFFKLQKRLGEATARREMLKKCTLYVKLCCLKNEKE
jgi:hypothetical protein